MQSVHSERLRSADIALACMTITWLFNPFDPPLGIDALAPTGCEAPQVTCLDVVDLLLWGRKQRTHFQHRLTLLAGCDVTAH